MIKVERLAYKREGNKISPPSQYSKQRVSIAFCICHESKSSSFLPRNTTLAPITRRPKGEISVDGQTLFQEFTPLEKDLRVTRDGLLRFLHEEAASASRELDGLFGTELFHSREKESRFDFSNELNWRQPLRSCGILFARKRKKWNELPLLALRKRNNSIKIPNYLRRGNSSDPNSSRILRERTWNEKYKKCERMGIARVTVFLQFNGSCALPSPPRYPVQRAIFTSGYLQLSFENSGRGGRKKGREERAGIEVAVIKKSGKLRAGSIRFGGKKGIDEGKKLFRNGNNGGWNAFLREMRLQEATGEQRFLITISNSDTPENICTPRFLSSIKDCYIGAKIVLEFRVYFENRFNLLFYM